MKIKQENQYLTMMYAANTAWHEKMKAYQKAIGAFRVGMTPEELAAQDAEVTKTHQELKQAADHLRRTEALVWGNAQ